MINAVGNVDIGGKVTEMVRDLNRAQELREEDDFSVALNLMEAHGNSP